MRWFSNYGQPDGIINFIEKSTDDSEFQVLGFAHFLRQLYLGFSYLYIGRLDSGVSALEKVEDILKEDNRSWANEVKQLARSVRTLVQTEPSVVNKKLDGFVSQTKQALKIK